MVPAMCPGGSDGETAAGVEVGSGKAAVADAMADGWKKAWRVPPLEMPWAAAAAADISWLCD